jgi:hypothetical protein
MIPPPITSRRFGISQTYGLFGADDHNAIELGRWGVFNRGGFGG